MKKRLTILSLLFLLLHPCIGFAQTNSSVNFKKFGVGIGYSSNFVVVDSIRPVEISLRYRIGNKHTLQFYTPLSYKKSSIRNSDDTRKQTLWGFGLGYDYTLYNHSFLDFFIGINASYQRFENRIDSHIFYDRELYDGSFVLTESIYYYWDRVKGAIISPHVGVRFKINRRVIVEPRINILMPILSKNSYSFYKTRNPQNESSWSTWESFYLDKNKKEFDIQSGGSIYLYYIF